MTTKLEVGLTLLLLGSVALPACVRASLPLAEANGSPTVHVAAPTGEREADRASILAALERVQPGGTVQFAPGTYLIGPLIRIPVAGVTLLGHPEGTTIRGCVPEEFVEHPVALFACHGFELSGGHQTVRGLTFEYTWHGLFVGCCFPPDLKADEARYRPQRLQIGGNLIENNTFRYSPNGIRVVGESDEPTVIRNNRFVDVYHAIGINGRTVHFLDNDISVREPTRIPISAHPGGAIGLMPFGDAGDHTSCADNVIAGNRVEGHPDAIHIGVFAAGTSCRRNVIRDNTIVVRRVRWVASWEGIRLSDEADSTVVGIPLGLSNVPAAIGADTIPGQRSVIEDNLIEGNRIIGAEGLGIELLHALRNRITTDRAAHPAFPGRPRCTTRVPLSVPLGQDRGRVRT